MRYKSLALAVAALLSSTVLAAAADFASRMRVPEHYLDWNGLYGGVNAGYGMQDGTNAGGFMWGGTIGYNVRRGDLVFGAEGDYDWSNIRATSSNGPCAIAASGCQLSNNWIATVRGRIGYAFERYMPYLTGGLAFGNARIDSGIGQDNTNRAGFVLGGGVEYRLGQNWTTKIEYLYLNLSDHSCGSYCSVPIAGDFRQNIVRVGLNYSFAVPQFASARR